MLLHGRGSNEADIIGLADHLPAGAAYAAVRAPIAEGGGYAWFANRGIGRPVAESLRDDHGLVPAWLDESRSAPVGRSCWSGSAAAPPSPAAWSSTTRPATPARRSCTARCPFDAGVPTTPGRLDGVPVLVVHGDQDHVIPRELLDRTWSYLTPTPAPTPPPCATRAGTASARPPSPSCTGGSRPTVAELGATS